MLESMREYECSLECMQLSVLSSDWQILVMSQTRVYTDVPKPSHFTCEGLACETSLLGTQWLNLPLVRYKAGIRGDQRSKHECN